MRLFVINIDIILKIDCLMALTTCLVCLLVLLVAMAKIPTEEQALVAGT